jgi:glycosyltransferase involved in cell wall biosynthesis
MKFAVDIWHNILWSKYKGAVFSEMHQEAINRGIDIRFFQIAETENNRRVLSTVDLVYHQYPYRLISKGAYEDIPLLRLTADLFWSVLRSRADIIVLAGYHKIEYWAQLVAARLGNKKVMVFCEATYLDRPRQSLKDRLKRLFFRNCDGFLCYGQRSKQYLIDLGAPEKKIYVGCHAASTSIDYGAAEALVRRGALLAAGPDPTILYVGRFAPEKNIRTLLDAFARLAAANPAVKLRLVGDGPERQSLQTAVSDLGLLEAVSFVGSLSGPLLFDEYSKAAVLVLPSSSEAWGLVVNEALSYGCPVVVSDNCGCVPELVVEGVTGFSFAPFDVENLEEKLYLALSPQFQRLEVARACVQLMSDFTAKNAAISIVDGVLDVLGGTNTKCLSADS